MSHYKDGWEVIIQEGFKAPKDAQPILCVWGCLVGASLKQGNFLPKLCPYVWGCEKEGSDGFLYENEFGVVIYARTGPKHGSDDVRNDIANMFVGVPHAVNQRDTPQPIRKIPVNGCSRVQKFEHPVVDVAINEQCHRVLWVVRTISRRSKSSWF